MTGPDERDREAARKWQESTCPNADVHNCCNCETCISGLADVLATRYAEGFAAGRASAAALLLDVAKTAAVAGSTLAVAWPDQSTTFDLEAAIPALEAIVARSLAAGTPKTGDGR